MTQQLNSALYRHSELRRRLLEAEPEIDEVTLLDTLEGLTDLNEAIAEIVRSALLDASYISGLRQRIDEMRQRLDRLEARHDRKRTAVLEAMEAAGIAKIAEPDFTVTLKAVPPSVCITDETAIPEWFWIPQPARLDKRSLLDTLKAGTGVTGAELANRHNSLAIRTK
jgi:hypothetical protein